MYARAYGKTPFVIYEGAWSILQRDLERDIFPMCRHEGETSRLSLTIHLFSHVHRRTRSGLLEHTR